jgi:hypothetical protein
MARVTLVTMIGATAAALACSMNLRRDCVVMVRLS